MTVYLLCYAAAFLFSASGHHYLAGAGLIFAAVYLYIKDYSRTGNLLHLRAVFSLSFVGGEGLACLKLSHLAAKWPPLTWLSFFTAYIGFYAVFQFLEQRSGGRVERVVRRRNYSGYEQSVFFCTFAITAVSLGCFLLEASALGFIPLFTGIPHAYSSFHLTGVHYFTVTCVLVPACSVLYFSISKGNSRGMAALMIVMDVVALAIPILCVSRFQLLFAVVLAVLTYMLLESRLNLFYIAGALAALAVLYVLLTIARSHEVSYLNAVFEMKQKSLPIVLTQPYMYIAHNYENFNFMVAELDGHTWGMRSLAPLWTLTGLKFAFPALAPGLPLVLKAELTTLTLFYDAYYDFGLAGVLVFSGLLGAAAFYLMQWLKTARSPMVYLIYAQMALYLLLSFFTTWFSNPTTWFYLAVTVAAAFAVSRKWGTVR